MTMKLKKIAALLTVCAMGASLAACGSDSASTTAASNNTTKTTAGSTTTAGAEEEETEAKTTEGGAQTGRGSEWFRCNRRFHQCGAGNWQH